jgi:hypothetical protein
VVVGEGHAPLWQYFSRLLKAGLRQTSASLPQRRESRALALFPLQTGRFLGTMMGAMMAIADPSGRHPSAASPTVVVGEGYAPVVAVLRAACKKKQPHFTPGKGHLGLDLVG